MSRNEPANAADIAEMAKKRISAADEAKGIQPSIEVAWRNGSERLPVIVMPIDALRYNPETHRIKAQRDFDPLGDKAIVDDPWGEAAQEYLGRLLAALPLDPSREDPQFLKLQENLREYGQKEPGIITPSGILINGNTRCAALRKNGETNMRVAVLPTDWNWDDVALVELDLQMRRDYKRDYSYVNLLIALSESVGVAGADQTAKAFHLAKKTLETHLWVLALLRDIVDRSKVDGQSLNLRDFETDQGKLDELQRAYFALHRSDPVAAERLKDARVLALLLDKSKTDMRWVEDDFADTYLSRFVEVGGSSTQATVTIPGLDVEVPSSTGGNDSQLGVLIDQVAKTKTQIRTAEGGDFSAMEAFLAQTSDQVEKAMDAAGRVKRLKKSQAAAIDRLNTAADALEICIAEIQIAKSKNALDEVALNDALLSFQGVFERFAAATLRVVSEDIEGVRWLRASQQDGES
ncbi:MAG: hypothetical protein JWP32_2180 [Schumannella sp.]|nr:hypothetical protein [Schumannella sp.]